MMTRECTKYLAWGFAGAVFLAACGTAAAAPQEDPRNVRSLAVEGLQAPVPLDVTAKKERWKVAGFLMPIPGSSVGVYALAEVAGPDKEEVLAINRALGDWSLGRVVQERVEQAIRTQGRYRVIPAAPQPEGTLPDNPEERKEFIKRLASRIQADTVLICRLHATLGSAGLLPKDEESIYHERISLHATLIDLRKGEVVAEHKLGRSFDPGGEGFRFEEFAADGGRLVKERMTKEAERIAEELARKLEGWEPGEKSEE
jgi:hypothetical protein